MEGGAAAAGAMAGAAPAASGDSDPGGPANDPGQPAAPHDGAGSSGPLDGGFQGGMSGSGTDGTGGVSMPGSDPLAGGTLTSEPDGNKR